MLKGDAISLQLFKLPTRGLYLNSPFVEHTQTQFENMLSASAAQINTASLGEDGFMMRMH